jgi:hypothetical protein
VPVLPSRIVLPPFQAGTLLGGAFHASLAAAILGGLLGALGLGPAFLLVPLVPLGVSLALLWGRHAGPLLRLGARPARASGRNLLVVSLGALALPWAAFRAPWTAWGLLCLLGLAAFLHTRQVRKERTRF